jgi:hypothetical protein
MGRCWADSSRALEGEFLKVALAGRRIGAGATDADIAGEVRINGDPDQRVTGTDGAGPGMGGDQKADRSMPVQCR